MGVFVNAMSRVAEAKVVSVAKMLLILLLLLYLQLADSVLPRYVPSLRVNNLGQRSPILFSQNSRKI